MTSAKCFVSGMLVVGLSFTFVILGKGIRGVDNKPSNAPKMKEGWSMTQNHENGDSDQWRFYTPYDLARPEPEERKRSTSKDLLSKESYGNRVAEMWQAVRRDDLQLLRTLIAQGVSVNESDNEDLTPLHYAAHNGQEEMAEILLNHGADINATDLYGYTPLMLAARNGQIVLVKRLLGRGANPNIQADESASGDIDGPATALKIAERNNYHEIAELLRHVGAQK